jgi:hypothetical protein
MNNNKPTLLQRYWKTRLDFTESHKDTMPLPAQIWSFQELLYRIEVLEVFQQFASAAPYSDDKTVLLPHYKVVNWFIENLKTDRVYPPAPNDDIKKQRETAHTSLCSVIEDYIKRFSNYIPKSPEQYGKDIGRIINTVLPAWIQYRNTINEIKLTEEQT